MGNCGGYLSACWTGGPAKMAEDNACYGVLGWDILLTANKDLHVGVRGSGGKDTEFSAGWLDGTEVWHRCSAYWIDDPQPCDRDNYNCAISSENPNWYVKSVPANTPFRIRLLALTDRDNQVCSTRFYCYLWLNSADSQPGWTDDLIITVKDNMGAI